MYGDDDLIYVTDDIANEDNEDLNTDNLYVDFNKNNSRKDVAVKSNSLTPMSKSVFQFVKQFTDSHEFLNRITKINREINIMNDIYNYQ